MFVYSFFLLYLSTFREGHALLSFVAFPTVIDSCKDSNYLFTDLAKYNNNINNFIDFIFDMKISVPKQ